MAQKQIVIGANACYVAGEWDATQNLETAIITGANGAINIGLSQFQPKTTPIGYTYDPANNAGGGGGDDTTPFWYTTDSPQYPSGRVVIIGGNHGLGTIVPTVPGHGKTIADVGSLWKSNSDDGLWCLLDISGDQLVLIPKDSNPSGALRPSLVSTGGFPLSHVSGAVHTADIAAPTDLANGQAFGLMRHLEKSVCVDDGDVIPVFTGTAQPTLTGEKIVFTDRHEVLDPVDWVNKIVSNRPATGYATQADMYAAAADADSIALIENRFYFGKEVGELVIDCKFTALKDIPSFDWYSGQQECQWWNANATSVLRRIPFFKKYIAQDGAERDWQVGRNMLAETAYAYDCTPNLWEDGIPPNRFVERMTVPGSIGVSEHVFGFLNAHSTYGRELNCEVAIWELGAFKKYPRLFDPIGGMNLRAGQVIRGVTVKSWTKPSAAPLNFEWQGEYKHDQHFILDFDQSGTKTYTIPSGFTFQPFRKSRNVLHNVDGNTVTITANITADRPTAHFEFAFLASQDYIDSLPVNCQLSAWSDWSAWDTNAQSRTRTRAIVRQPNNGGIACGPTTETQQVTQAGWDLKLSGTNLTGQSAQPLPAMASVYGFVRFKLLDNTPNNLLQLSSNWLSPAGKGAWIIRVNDVTANWLRLRNYGNSGITDCYITDLQVGEWVTVAFEIDQTKAYELHLEADPAKTVSPGGGANTNGLVSDYLQIGSSSVEISDVWIREGEPTEAEKEAILSYLSQ